MNTYNSKIFYFSWIFKSSTCPQSSLCSLCRGSDCSASECRPPPWPGWGASPGQPRDPWAPAWPGDCQPPAGTPAHSHPARPRPAASPSPKRRILLDKSHKHKAEKQTWLAHWPSNNHSGGLLLSNFKDISKYYQMILFSGKCILFTNCWIIVNYPWTSNWGTHNLQLIKLLN